MTCTHESHAKLTADARQFEAHTVDPYVWGSHGYVLHSARCVECNSDLCLSDEAVARATPRQLARYQPRPTRYTSISAAVPA